MAGGPGDVESIVRSTLVNLGPGVTELVFLPADDTPELRALAQNDFKTYVDQSNTLQPGSAVHKLVEDTGVTLLGFAALRDARAR